MGLRSFQHAPCDAYDGFDRGFLSYERYSTGKCESDNLTNMGPVSAVPRPSSAMRAPRPPPPFAVTEIPGARSTRKRGALRLEDTHLSRRGVKDGPAEPPSLRSLQVCRAFKSAEPPSLRSFQVDGPAELPSPPCGGLLSQGSVSRIHGKARRPGPVERRRPGPVPFFSLKDTWSGPART